MAAQQEDCAGMPRTVVAYLINQYPAPSHTFIRREIRELERLGVEVRPFSLRRWPEALVDPADREEAGRTPVVLEAGAGSLARAFLGTLLSRPVRLLGALLLAARCGWRSDRGLLAHAAYLVEACLLLEWVRRAGASHVHAHFATNSTTVAMLLHALGGPPFSFTTHGHEPFGKPLQISLPAKLSRARFAVGISQFGVRQLQRWCPPGASVELHAVACGVDDAFLDRTPAPIPAGPRAVFVGRLCTDKAPGDLLDAAEAVRGEGLRPRVVFIGDGPLRPELERRASGDTVFLGWCDQATIIDELEAARVLVLPSLAEGLPVVLMEAYALGRPVISTHVAGIPELVVPGHSGWLVAPGDTAALARALAEALFAPPAKLRAMAEAGRRHVKRHHRCSREAEKLARLFAASRPHSRPPWASPRRDYERGRACRSGEMPR